MTPPPVEQAAVAAGFKDRKNIYVCQKCGGCTVTIDKDDGTTPFMIRCRAKDHHIHGAMLVEGCKGTAYSVCYNLNAVIGSTYMEPEYEWYRPGNDELRKITHAATLQHVSMGGLLLRRAHRG